MPINPAIALGVKGIELADPLAQYGRVAAIQQAQQQNALANMQMQEYERARQEEQSIRNRLAGGAGLEDTETRNFLLGSKTGRDILKQQSEFQKAQTEEAARRAKLMADTEAMYRNMAGQISNKAEAATFLQNMLNDPALKNAPITRIPLMEQVRRIPEDPQGLDNWVKQFALGTTKWITENKPVTQQINRMGQTDIVQIPGLGGRPTTVGTYADVPLPPEVQAQKLQQSVASAPRITVSTEKKYGERFGGLIADADAAKLSAAEGAPKAAATADRIMDILESGKVFTGTGANVRLQLAKALNLAGKTDEEKIANTEVLGAQLAETTLGAIKSSNLGAGQGFTNADREFLEKAKAGQITFEAESLKRLAKLSRQAAEQSAEAWNKRVKQIPASALEGTGITAEPVVVPKRGKKAEAATPAPAGVDPALWNVMTPQERALWQK